MRLLQRSIAFSLFCGSLSMAAFAQQNPDNILLTIDKTQYGKEEVLKQYKKNLSDTNAPVNKKDFSEYVDLFLNYKLKILEAKELRIDTLKSFTKEYTDYRNEIKEPYLRNDSIFTAFVKQAYEHGKSAVRVSHLLVKSEYGSSAKDTLIAYKKIQEIKKRLNKGEDFEKLIVELSEDPTAHDTKDPQSGEMLKGNKGDLGYFSTFEILYPIEETAYSLKLNQISAPIKTDIGYHILKLTNQIPLKGSEFTLQHIWTGDDSVRALGLAQAAYSELNAGKDFTDVAKKYSVIAGTEYDNGFLYNKKPSQLLPDYLEKIENMEEGGYTAPFKTKYGWHIIKLVSVQPFLDFIDQEQNIGFRISRDERGTIAKTLFLNQLKKEQGFKENRKSLEEMRPYFNDSIFLNEWSYPASAKLDKEIFTFSGKSYKQKDFADFIIGTQTRSKRRVDLDFLYNGLYNEYVEKICTDFEDARLEEKYPAFKELLDNYKEGLLIFAINDRMVWSKAMIDTNGLNNFYEANKNSHFTTNPDSVAQNFYMWRERADITLWKFNNNVLTEEKALKVLQTAQKKSWTAAKTYEELLKKAGIKKDSDTNITQEWGLYEFAEQQVLSTDLWKKGLFVVSTDKSTGSFSIADVHEIRKPELKSLFDAKGYYISDYQNFLEKQWIESLRKKYSFTVNTQILNTIGN